MCKEDNMNTASGLRITMILLGIAVTPVLLPSPNLGNQLSSDSLISVMLLGGVILTLLSAITISVGEKARLLTYGTVEYSFGEKGAIAINILMVINLFGWIAVTANMFGYSVHDLPAQNRIEAPLALLVAASCVIFVASTVFGFSILGKVAQVVMPAIALVLRYVLYVTTHTEVPAPAAIAEMSTGVAVSTVVGTTIVLVATLPDFGSFVHNRKHALIVAGMTFLVAYPLLYWAGATPSAISGQGSLLNAMAVFGVVMSAALSLILAYVIGNVDNMSQETLVVSILLSRFLKWQIAIALGILSAIVGSMDIMAWFIPFLLFLGITTPPVTGICITGFFLYRRNGYQESVLTQGSQVKVLTFAAWITGIAVGFMTVKGLFTLTTIPSVDSILVACIAYATLSRASQHR